MSGAMVLPAGLYWLALLGLALGCSRPPQGGELDQAVLSKIGFDLAPLRDDGLYGPPDGLRALSYEFCVPSDQPRLAEVRSIDPTLKLYPSSRGRIGCGRDETLAIGSTHQNDFRRVLARLAALPYVARIEQSFGE